MTAKELVKRAVAGRPVARLPVFLFNKDIEQSDIVAYRVENAASFRPAEPGATEWGFVWESLDDTMGQPKNIVLLDWGQLADFVPPDGKDPTHFRNLPRFLDRYPDQYVLVDTGISGFTIVTFLRGFENVMEDLYWERENLEKLCDIVFGFEEDLIRQAVRFPGVDAFAFYDDWGSQNSLLISPAMWREVFKPRYKRQFDLLHAGGKQVYFHSCGYVYDILPDLIELGADIINLNQIDVIGLEKLSQFNGRVCFNCPVDHQREALAADPAAIRRQAHAIATAFGGLGGGFLGYVEEYHSIGMPLENYYAMWEAFRTFGREPAGLERASR